MIRVSVAAKQVCGDVKAALEEGNRKKAERIIRIASRQGIPLLTEAFAAALVSGKTSPPSDAKALSQEIDTSTLTAEKTVRYTVRALQRGERSKAAAIMRHAVHQGISPADLAEVGLKNTEMVDDASSTSSSPVIDESEAGVTQSEISNTISEEEST